MAKKSKKIKKISDAAKFLLDTGLLFEVNRKVLHPFGLALEVSIDIKDDEAKVSFGKLWDYRDDPEGMLYGDDVFLSGKESFDKFMEEFGNERLKTRNEKLGFIYQEETIQPKNNNK